MDNPKVIVGLEKADDAGVYKLTDDLALVQTVDFITPIVDDPESFGMIAAANSLSDVYAMGARPVTAMNIVCFPGDTMDIEILRQILAGAVAKLNEAGVAMVGGHSVKDEEVKFGLSVSGLVRPDKVVTKSSAKAGDKLILTKPLGTGIMNTALKAGLLDDESLALVTKQMTALNDKASRIMVSLGASAATDVSGFGLLGHACEMAENSGVSIAIDSEKVPLIAGTEKLAAMGLLPAGLYSNREFRESMIQLEAALPTWLMDALFDPQTSGGLLIASPPQAAGEMLARIKKAGYKEAAIIGTVVAGQENRIILR
jgi:selenide,water dikinase